MSEELLQTIPLQLGRYTYYRLGNSTLGQLKKAGLIPKRNYGSIENKKPDGLATCQGAVKAVVEYKPPAKLRTDKLVDAAIKQELDVARALAKIFIVTDGQKSYWINALTGERIRDSEGRELRAVFHPFAARNTATLEYLLDEVDSSISDTNSVIRSAKLIDPTPLATRLWQTIWVATGKSPIKCLYNVVELFIFKFLSDLQVMPEDIAFARVREKSNDNAEDGLEFYARNSRVRIYKLFPEAADGTTIINGTIFVNEAGEPNLSQSILFRRSLDHLHAYTEEFGSLTKINKQFKTRLYESFLKQEVEALGQYFTPRRIVQTIIRMAGLDSESFQFGGKRICDPFCGVGGFPLEALNMNEAMKGSYAPDRNGKISLPFVMHGFDKGFERDDERTVILAKANMLIYLAELLFANPNCSTEFSRVFNETFTLFRDNLGTFGHIIDGEADKYDFILSNPPYVTSGSGIIKEELKQTPHTTDEYPINALGLEGLSLEWIVKSLRRNGRAFIVIPDGILARIGGKKLRDHMLDECYLDAIVSLPIRTFFANFKHTYILAITKKNDRDDVQQHPVFTYLISEIGERLTSVRREEIDENDLPEMEGLFKIFTATRGESRDLLETQSKRCKVQDVQRFRDSSHWLIDRWWSRDERVELGLEEGSEIADKTEVDTLLVKFNDMLGDYDRFILSDPLEGIETKEVALGDTDLFSLFIGKRVLRKDTTKDESKVPVYSANVFTPMGYIESSNIEDFQFPSILWGIDGNFEFNLISPNEVFATTDHCGTIQILDSTIVPEYVLYAVNLRRIEENFDRSFRANLDNMRRFVLQMPVNKSGSFNVRAQRTIAARFTAAREKRAALEEMKKELDAVFGRYVGGVHL